MWILLCISLCCLHKLVYCITIRNFCTCLHAGASKCSNAVSTICNTVETKLRKEKRLKFVSNLHDEYSKEVHFYISKRAWSNNKDATRHFRNTCLKAKMKTRDKHSLFIPLFSIIIASWVGNCLLGNGSGLF